MVVHVDFANLEFAIVLSGKFVNDWRDHAARTTPRSPEIHKIWNRASEYFGIEIAIRQLIYEG
jgi:hypothetical protein